MQTQPCGPMSIWFTRFTGWTPRECPAPGEGSATIVMNYTSNSSADENESPTSGRSSGIQNLLSLIRDRMGLKNNNQKGSKLLDARHYLHTGPAFSHESRARIRSAPRQRAEPLQNLLCLFRERDDRIVCSKFIGGSCTSTGPR